ncbi:IclR family transcriptional regulator [Sphingobium lactosutens]|uniref:IclR family transcriptional regulator n=1 Tax=Sphingobium lactosutens TaxID=522773 RepID=UPI0015B8F140|nr:IclR family transcriptional regulator [Sphingobium lactosutens]NWK94574.1 IclR family transcriptional regulator [Sphingobium lactosutens]
MNRTGLKGTYNAPALEKSFEIMELLSKNAGGLLLSDIAAKLERSVGELFRIVIVMEKHGYLQKSEITDKYAISYKLLEIAFGGTPSQNISAAAIPQMEMLSEAIGQSCHLVVANGGQGLVIARQENPGTRGFTLKLGAAIDLLRSCSGHVLLAFSPPARTERIIAQATINRSDLDTRKLSDDLVKVREQGFDCRKSPITFGVTDISFPIFGFDGDILAALTVPFLELVDGSQKLGMDESRQLLAEATYTISDTLGFNKSSSRT